jgi:hypothetical protein
MENGIHPPFRDLLIIIDEGRTIPFARKARIECGIKFGGSLIAVVAAAI